jgi:acyl-CoA hydrolase
VEDLLSICKSLSGSATVLLRVMMPMDANTAGNVFGGAILKLVEEAAWLSALKHAHCNLVTKCIERLDFLSPVYIGDIVRMNSCINYVGKTSMEIGVRVEAENPMTGEVRHTGTAFLTYVALDKDGKPQSIPPIKPVTDDEKRRWADAETRKMTRLREIQQEKIENSQEPS